MSLDDGLQPRAYRPVFNRFGRLHIPGILAPDSADGLYRSVATAGGWRRAIHVAKGKDAEITLDGPDAMPEAERDALEARLLAMTSDSFQYRFDTIRVSADIHAGRPVLPVLEAAFRFMNGEAFLGFVRAMTGDDSAAYCDMAATRYRPGHFLTAHDDLAPEQDRLFAYVLNLTPRWRADWGGILMFLDEEDHVSEGYVPAYNALNIFTVPQRHAVSLVAPFAGGDRLSLTGWIRSSVPPEASDHGR